MITPLMYLLSCIKPDLTYDKQVNISHLNKEDQLLIQSEAEIMGRKITSEDILLTEDIFGNNIVDTSQVVGSEIVDIHWSTAIILTRLKDCYAVYKGSGISTEATQDIRDIGEDNLILTLEKNPDIVYLYVCNTLEDKNLSYDKKFIKIYDLYRELVSLTEQGGSSISQEILLKRLREQSQSSFWKHLLLHDYAVHYGASPTDIVGDDLLPKLRKELQSLGFYGFTNPFAMYNQFNGSRLERKVDYQIDEKVLSFLNKIVRSGGIKLQ